MSGVVGYLVLSAALVGLAAASASDYCNIENCKKYHKGTHTLCAHPESGPAERCLAKGDMGSGFTEEEKKQLIDYHNEHRRKVANGEEEKGNPGPQPPADSMPDLTWDDELATIAQRWADQCIWGHDDCRDDSRFQVGQNAAYLSTTGDARDLSLKQLMDMWYDEVSDFDSNIVPSYRSTGVMTGHYTQLVWGKTTLMGCGLRMYFDGQMNRKFLVCNYGPSGNMKHEPVYETEIWDE